MFNKFPNNYEIITIMKYIIIVETIKIHFVRYKFSLLKGKENLRPELKNLQLFSNIYIFDRSVFQSVWSKFRNFSWIVRAGLAKLSIFYWHFLLRVKLILFMMICVKILKSFSDNLFLTIVLKLIPTLFKSSGEASISKLRFFFCITV